MQSPITTTNSQASFWSGSYNGRQIATAQHSTGWVVYLDRVMEANRTFADSADAIRWLQRKIDDASFDNRAAMLCSGHSRTRKSHRKHAA